MEEEYSEESTTANQRKDPRANTRLGRANLFLAKKVHACEQCETNILPDTVYVTFTALSRNKGKVVWARTSRIHVDCMGDYARENYRRFKELPKKRGGRQLGSTGGGRPSQLTDMDPEVRAARLQLMKDISHYRLRLVAEIEKGGNKIDRYKYKLGEKIAELYNPNKEYKPELTSHGLFGPIVSGYLAQTMPYHELNHAANIGDWYSIGYMLMGRKPGDIMLR